MKNQINCDDVGWCLLVTIKRMDVYNAQQSKAKKMNAPLRFAKYKTFTSDNKQTWRKCVSTCAAVIRECRSSNKKPTIAVYNAARRKIQAQINRVGNLRSNHLMGILSVLGFIPLSWFPLVSVGPKKVYAHLELVYPNSAPGKEECMVDVRHLIEWKLGRPVSMRYDENMLCKCGRFWNGCDGQYWDLIAPLFPLFSVRQKNIVLVERSGKKRTVAQFFTFKGGEATTHMSCNTNCPRRSWMKIFI
jgi:hypothetical protein